MKFIFILVFLFFGTSLVAQDVRLEFDREEILDRKVHDTVSRTTTLSGFNFPANDVPYGDRRVSFKLTNIAQECIIINGLAYDATFQPTGFLISFDVTKGKWNVPTPEREAGEVDQPQGFDKKVLQPGESLEFSSLLSSTADNGKRFKRTVYYSLCSDNCRHQEIDVEFVLSK